MAKRIFLSHANADKKLVEKTIPFIATALGVVANDIFCSSIEGHGVTKGNNFVDSIRDEVTQAEVIIALISPSYLESSFCMAELGAAWALNSKRFPIIVPPLDFKVMNATLLGIVGVRIDDEDSMTQLFDDMRKCMSTEVSSVVASRAVRGFLSDWESTLSGQVVSASKIDAPLYENLKEQLKTVTAERDDAERELKKSAERIDELSKAERFSDVQKVNKLYEKADWEKDFDEHIRNVKKMKVEVGGAEVCRQLILGHIGIDKPIDANIDGYQFDRAHEVGVYDPENKKFNYGNEEVVKLFAILDVIIDFINDNPEVEKMLQGKNKRSNPNTIKFWEDHLRL